MDRQQMHKWISSSSVFYLIASLTKHPKYSIKWFMCDSAKLSLFPHLGSSSNNAECRRRKKNYIIISGGARLADCAYVPNFIFIVIINSVSFPIHTLLYINCVQLVGLHHRNMHTSAAIRAGMSTRRQLISAFLALASARQVYGATADPAHIQTHTKRRTMDSTLNYYYYDYSIKRPIVYPYIYIIYILNAKNPM